MRMLIADLEIVSRKTDQRPKNESFTVLPADPLEALHAELDAFDDTGRGDVGVEESRIMVHPDVLVPHLAHLDTILESFLVVQNTVLQRLDEILSVQPELNIQVGVQVLVSVSDEVLPDSDKLNINVLISCMVYLRKGFFSKSSFVGKMLRVL